MAAEHHGQVRPEALIPCVVASAAAVTFAAGGVGGLWLPSFTMGAAIGAAFGGLLGLGQPGYLTLVGSTVAYLMVREANP